MIDLMNGSHFAKQYVNTYLQQDIPIRLIRYRNGWNLDSTALPDPEEYLAHEPLAIDHWPSIITVALSTAGLTRIGFAGPDPLYRISYNMRTYTWVRSEGSPETTLMRDRLTTVVRSALLDYPCLKAFDARTSFRAVIDESTFREEFSDITLLKGDRFMAGSFIGYTLEIDEVVTRMDIGTVDEINLVVKSSSPGQQLNGENQMQDAGLPDLTTDDNQSASVSVTG
jgi:hypothetical protein